MSVDLVTFAEKNQCTRPPLTKQELKQQADTGNILKRLKISHFEMLYFTIKHEKNTTKPTNIMENIVIYIGYCVNGHLSKWKIIYYFLLIAVSYLFEYSILLTHNNN